jgi:hypothetical protein
MTAPEFDPLYSAKLRIERAEEHLNDLEAKIHEFFLENPHSRVTEPDSDGIHEIHKFRFTKGFPFRWRILATEIIEHLRASLDHATWATAYLSTKNADLEFGVFPFSKDSTHFDNRMRGVSKDVPAEIQTLLRTFQPYKGGNDLLFILNDLCNLSKHALVAFVAGATAHFEVSGVASPELAHGVQFYDPPEWDRAKNEVKFARTRLGTKLEHQLKLGVYVALEYREITSTEPATAVFDAMLREVQRIVLAIEAESRRIGLIK